MEFNIWYLNHNGGKNLPWRSTIGPSPFVRQSMAIKVQGWVEEINSLHVSAIATTQPHAAFSAFTHGLICSKWNYALRVTDLETHHYRVQQPLENAFNSAFVPALTGLPAPGKLTRDLLALPCKLGGLGLINPKESCSEQHQTSKRITAALVNLNCGWPGIQYWGLLLNSKEWKERRQNPEKTEAKKLCWRTKKQSLRQYSKKHETLSRERGASIWLTALPIDIHGLFALHKSAFRDALSLRYNWPIENKPSFCSCGHTFSIDHALSCPTGGFPSIRHNEVRDITASLLSEVCHNVSIEPHLQLRR